MKQEGFLIHQGNIISQAFHGQTADVDAVHRDRPRLRIIEAIQQADNRCFSHPAGPHQGHHFPRGHPEGKIPQHWQFLVGKGHVFKTDLPPGPFQGYRIRGFNNVRLLIHHLEHPFSRPHRSLNAIDDLRQPFQGRIGHDNGGHEGKKLALGYGPGKHPVQAIPENHGHPE